MQSWANTINGIGINSCEAGASLASAVWPRSQMASQAICRTQGASGGMMSTIFLHVTDVQNQEPMTEP